MTTVASFMPLGAESGKAVHLTMQRLWLTGEVLPAGARLVAQHVFRSGEDAMLEVIYSFPLPRDAALRSFRITGEGFEVHSKLMPTEEAVKTYEAGLAQGSLATLARQYGDGVINLTVGNIRPGETVTVSLEILCGVELRDDGFRFRFPFTLAPAYHARAKAAVARPGEGEMELPPDEFGDVILPRFCEDAEGLHQVGFNLTIASQLELVETGSPSHAVRVSRDGGSTVRVALAPEADIPNRDLVLDARFRPVEPQVLAARGKDGIGRFAAIVPSTSFGAARETARRIVILVDRSGSMQGNPLEQARRAIQACLGALSGDDLFGLVVFNDEVEVFERRLVEATQHWRREARDFMRRTAPRGGTELARGFLEAAKMLGGEGGDVLIFTDGQVSGTEKILAAARTAGVRLHCLGIGSASQDRFLTLLARETGGISRFVTPLERVDLEAVELFASIRRPVASGLKTGENVQPAPPSWVFGGTPVLLFGELAEGEDGPIELSWEGGRMALPIPLAVSGVAETVRLLQGSRLITDWESRYPAEEAWGLLAWRKKNRVAGRLVSLSETYGLASREMSLVAVVERAGDRAGELPETRVVPVGMPQGTPFQAYFGGSTTLCGPLAGQSTGTARAASGPLKLGRVRAPGDAVLFDLASRIDPDGGMPGRDAEARAIATITVLFAFLSRGHTASKGAFRMHVARLMAFLESLKGLSAEQQKVVSAVLDRSRRGAAPRGDWAALAGQPGDHWTEVEQAVCAVK